MSLTPGAEVTQTSNVVHFDFCLRLAEFATAGHEPVDEFCGTLPPYLRKLVFESYPRGPSCQRDSAPTGDQRLLSFAAFDFDLEAPSGASRCLPGGTVAIPDLVDADLVLMPQRLGQGPFRDPPQQAEAVPVVGQLLILREAPEL